MLETKIIYCNSRKSSKVLIGINVNGAYKEKKSTQIAFNKNFRFYLLIKLYKCPSTASLLGKNRDNATY